MKTLKRIGIGGIVGCLLAAGGLQAFAGAAQTHEVLVKTTGEFPQATGSLNAARHSSDKNQIISCATSSGLGAVDTLVCFAVDRKGHQISCVSDDPGMIAAARSIGKDSAIFFALDPDGVHCVALRVENNSVDL
jgi:hypothetical protein